MRKRIAFAALLTAFIFIIASCGTNGKESTATAAPSEETEVKTEKAEEGGDVNEVTSPFENDLEQYKDILSSLPKDSYFAFVEMGEGSDVLLVTKEDSVFGEEQKKMSTEATVYAPDKDGKIIEYGDVYSGGTAYPFGVKDKKLYYANHTQELSAYVDEAESKLVETVEVELDPDNEDQDDSSFEDYYNAMTVYFFPVSMALSD